MNVLIFFELNKRLRLPATNKIYRNNKNVLLIFFQLNKRLRLLATIIKYIEIIRIKKKTLLVTNKIYGNNKNILLIFSQLNILAFVSVIRKLHIIYIRLNCQMKRNKLCINI